MYLNCVPVINIKFYLKRQKEKFGLDGTFPIYVFVNQPGEGRMLFSTGYRINPDFWNVRAQTVKGNTANVSQINAELYAIRCRLIEYGLDCHRKGIDVSKEELKSVIAGTTWKKQKLPIIFFEEQLDDIRQRKKFNTFRSYCTTLNYLKDFNAKSKLTWSSFDKSFDLKFGKFIRSFSPNMVDASLGKHLKNLKSLLNRASQEGLLRDEAFKRYHVLKNDSDVPSLETVELDYLWSVLDSLDKPKMEVLLSFLFMCETAIRISEAKVITWQNIQGSFIDLYERKNDKRKRPFLTERSHQVLNYFRQHRFEKPLVIKANFNTVLKEIFRELNLDREVEISRKVNLEMTTYLRPLYDVVCSKVARKTYVTLALSKNISPNYIQRTTGHSDPRILFKYNKLTDGMVAEFMANIKK